MCDIDRIQKKSKQTKSRVIQNTLDYIVEYGKRPKNLQLISGNNGKGCYVTEYSQRGMAPSGAIDAQSRLLSINSKNVEKQLFNKIILWLNTAPLPLRLKLQSPLIPVVKKSQRGKRRKRRKRLSTPSYCTERTLRSVTKGTKIPRRKSERTLTLGFRETRETPQNFEKNTKRRKSTGQFLKCRNARRTSDLPPPLSTMSQKVQLKLDQQFESVELKEELAYLRTSLARIYSALVITPRGDGEDDQEVVIPFNTKFMEHFRMLEVILKATRFGMVQVQDDRPSKPSTPTLRPEDIAIIPQKSDLAGVANIDQWFGRIIQELGVNHLNFESREEECVQSLEAICKLKEAADMMSNQVKSLDELLHFVNEKNEAAMQQVKEFKTKLIDAEQGVEKLVVKISTLRDRVGSLANCITKVQDPRVNRLASELWLAPIQANFTGDSLSNLILVNQLDPLIAVLDQMVNLVRKAEIVIRDGVLVELEKLTMYDSFKVEQDISTSGPSGIIVM